MYRASLVGGVGYCALDRRRAPLTGAEQRSCWSGTPPGSVDGFFDRTASTPLERGLLEVSPTPLRGAGPISGR